MSPGLEGRQRKELWTVGEVVLHDAVSHHRLVLQCFVVQVEIFPRKFVIKLKYAVPIRIPDILGQILEWFIFQIIARASHHCFYRSAVSPVFHTVVTVSIGP